MNSLINKQFSIFSSHHDRPILIDLRFKARVEPLPLIIFCHGFKGFKDWGHFNLIANEFANRGYAFLKFNFSHNGTTVNHPLDFVDLQAFANNNISIELNDLQDVIDAIVKEHPSVPAAPINKDKILLIGHSRGGGVVILKAAEDQRITAVSAWAPVDDLKKRYSQEVLGQWEKDGVYIIPNSRTGQDMPLNYQIVEDIYANTDRLDIPKAIKNLNKPLLAIHGSEDETLDFRKTRDMKELNPYLKVKIIDGANHTFGGSHPWQDDKLPRYTRDAVDTTDKFFQQKD